MSKRLFAAFILAVVLAIASARSIQVPPQILKADGTYTNPVVPKANSPDPGVLLVNGKYFVATTSNFGSPTVDNFPIRMSDNLVDWQDVGHIFTAGNGPDWAQSDYWAPEIHHIDGQFVAFFAARAHNGMLCVGAATSETPTGPFKDIGAPIVRNSTVGYIDATYFKDAATNTHYLIWKEDGNANGWPTPIFAQELAPNGLSVVGDKVQILTNNPHSWEGPLVEGPWMVKHETAYYLFFSANGYCGDLYAVGVARAPSPLGPFEKYPSNPILSSNDKWVGPGHCSVVPVADSNTDLAIVYHAWAAGSVCGSNPRLLLVDTLKWTADGWPVLADGNNSPSVGPQPIP